MKRVSFCTLGCRVNQYETRAIAELFVKQGFVLTPFGEECDVCFVNTCAVTAESERKSAQMIRRAARFAKEVRVCGCYVERRGADFADMPFVGLRVGCVGKTAVAGVEPEFAEDGFELQNIATVPLQGAFPKARAYIKVQDGCCGSCSYCVIPSLRGKPRSRPLESVVAEAERLVKGGCREVVLTGVETAAYSRAPLSALIERVARVEGLCRLRLGSLDPKALNPRFIGTVSSLPAVMPHFHISLQSGCDRILSLMRRNYTASDAKRRLEALREALPDVKFSADVICSFPTETEAELCETLDYLKGIGFSHIHAFSYSKRPGTEAARMGGQIPEAEKKRRMRYFLSECEKMECVALESKAGSAEYVLAERAGEGFVSGHTADFAEAFVQTKSPHAEGDFVRCEVLGREDRRLVCTEI